MRRIFLKRAYRDAVSWFGSENYRKAFKCAPRVGVFQADCRTFTNPFLMRMGTLDEVREALRLKIGGQPSVWDNCLGLAGVGELCSWESLCLDEHFLGKISVQGMNCTEPTGPARKMSLLWKTTSGSASTPTHPHGRP
ncbi:RNA cytidine acetyltransferase [Babesia caballi]|uniref:RNA cytidine acetyltransferase n=1 Tax=Babesia caballi TaxID=5871 RepID=A0AAV4LNL1_BABCB|nr:RNA cytidine acetyltransferase [Babesia caballi]